jgi:hypothetical protein
MAATGHGAGLYALLGIHVCGGMVCSCGFASEGTIVMKLKLQTSQVMMGLRCQMNGCAPFTIDEAA